MLLPARAVPGARADPAIRRGSALLLPHSRGFAGLCILFATFATPFGQNVPKQAASQWNETLDC